MIPLKVIMRVESKRGNKNKDESEDDFEGYETVQEIEYSLYVNRRFEFSNINADLSSKITLNLYTRSSS